VDLLLPCKPILTSRYKLVPEGDLYVLILEFDTLEFSSHPMMLEENKVSKEIGKLAKVISDRKEADVVSYLTKKLQVI